jgi:hypothetical protein
VPNTGRLGWKSLNGSRPRQSKTPPALPIIGYIAEAMISELRGWGSGQMERRRVPQHLRSGLANPLLTLIWSRVAWNLKGWGAENVRPEDFYRACLQLDSARPSATRSNPVNTQNLLYPHANTLNLCFTDRPPVTPGDRNTPPKQVRLSVTN